ncbi:ArnT family glycosyltransferase [Haladaptatus pallidirubidus]|uniref:Glycosyltransferase RgtA/B/C/D-like domain-containing protein n=1 Tax=Haladaptatus pallidirubidus TaxID=1008152 RepID=A0AAV3URB9_9EURY|nr:glycosyltransferase family 39 protein [Haladaptatus pallidirubidus]
MQRAIAGILNRIKQQIRDDLDADPYLAYILLFAFVLAGFWIWHHVPNFATRDERWRVVDPLEVLVFFLEDPGVESLREGLEHWRPYGATLYLYGIALIPVIAFAFLTGQLDAFMGILRGTEVDLWAHWNRTPAWVWIAIVLSSRLVNVLLAVGCVYVMYRIGTTMRDRATGRLASILLSLTWGFLVSAHEAGEDIPALFFLLLVVYFALRYSETGEESLFYAGCVCGGIAIAFKLTAGVSVALLGLAYLLYARNPKTTPREALVRPRLLVLGAILGATTIIVGFPSTFAGGFEVITDRVNRGTTNKGQPFGWLVAPSWWWILRGYLHGLGLPLFLGALGGVAASLSLLRERSTASNGVLLALAGTATYLTVFSRWAYIRAHHLLPTFALLILVLAVVLTRFYDSNRSLARPLIVVLLVTSGAYAGVGDLGYATQPRDQATSWLSSNAAENSTIETYTMDPQDAAVPHGMDVYQPSNREMTIEGETRTPSVRKWTRAMPQRCPTYIQLNYLVGVLYLAPDSHSERAKLLSNPQMESYYRYLLAEDKYPYEVAATFGPRPRFFDTDEPSPLWWDLLRTGLFPRTIQYGDAQDFGVDQYTMILERTGPCNMSTRSPFASGDRERN